MNNPVFNEAFKRALIYTVVTLIITIGGGLMTDQTIRYIVGSAIVTSGSVFLLRAGYEGYGDSNRAAEGKAIPGDVPVASPKLDVHKV